MPTDTAQQETKRGMRHTGKDGEQHQHPARQHQTKTENETVGQSAADTGTTDEETGAGSGLYIFIARPFKNLYFGNEESRFMF